MGGLACFAFEHLGPAAALFGRHVVRKLPREFAELLRLLLLILSVAGPLRETLERLIERRVLAGLGQLRRIRQLIGQLVRQRIRKRFGKLARRAVRLRGGLWRLLLILLLVLLLCALLLLLLLR